MARKNLLAALVLMLASSLVSAGGLEPGAASGALQIGGYADALFMKMDMAPETTFALGHLCLDGTAAMGDKVLLGAEIEWARADPNALSAAQVDAALVYGYIDYKFMDAVVMRAGKFLVPFNYYNVNLYPADVAKLPTAPFMNLELVPSKWAETGIEFHGKIDTGTAAGMNYAVYLVNGLESADLLLPDGTIYPATEAYISDMKNNDVELNDSDKAIGGRLGITTPVGFEAGISGYKGAYTPDGNNDLSLIGLDASYGYEAFELRGEYVKADQSGCSVEDQDGFYIQGAYKFLEKYEAVLRYDEVDIVGTAIDRFTLGGNYKMTDDLTFRLSYEWCSDIQDGLVGQLALRF